MRSLGLFVMVAAARRIEAESRSDGRGAVPGEPVTGQGGSEVVRARRPIRGTGRPGPRRGERGSGAGRG
jgi:hypothetical protein